jgi:hypothetical protein
MDKRKTLAHHGARHGAVEMVDASDEYGSSLSFNSRGTVASSRRPPSLWRPPLGLVMIYLRPEHSTGRAGFVLGRKNPGFSD